MLTTQLPPTLEAPPKESARHGELTPNFLSSLRDGFQMTPADRACHNAVTNNDLTALALNRNVIRGDDGHFSHRIKSKGITNQKKSGRCWMFAGLNVLRPQVIRDHEMEEFQFSTAYLQFWDKLEKSNLYLEAIIELRDADFLDREWEMVNKMSLEDGGWWNYVAGLVEKYGVVPLSAMPETHATSNTQTVNEILGRLLRVRAIRILDLHANGSGLEELRTEKNEALKEVYRFLTLNFGEPPTEFEWRYRRANKQGETKARNDDMQTVEETELTPVERHTPQSFRDKYVGRSLLDHVCLYNDPKNGLNRHYRFSRAHNIVGQESMHFVNIDTLPMKKIAIASILANEPVWFAVDMGFDQSESHGMMERQLFDYETLFGIDLTVSKADRTRFHAGSSGHAMTVMGVDLDKDGNPRKWLIENSWGDEKGKGGRWTLNDSWFDEHVYTIIAHKKHIPEEILKYLDDEPVTLPAWYPGAGGINS